MGPGGPLAPGEKGSGVFVVDPLSPASRYFSYASMVIPSNNAFIGNADPLSIQVFNAGGNFLGADFIVLGSQVNDAGTEVNDEVPASTAFLGQTVPNTGVDENGVVHLHGGFNPGGDILTAFPDADFTQPGYQVARIAIQVIPEPATVFLLAAGAAGLALIRRRRG